MQSFHAEDRISLISPIGYQGNNSCGYCKSTSGSACYYAHSESLTAQHYQDLLARGWRRSGKTLYKPDLLNQCCPHYTIRLDTTAFKTTKDQRQSLNRFRRFVLGDECIRLAKKLYPKAKAEKARQRNEFDLAGSVHGCEDSELKKHPEPAHRFKVSLEPNDFTEEKYALFENYQRNVHHEAPWQITPAGFRRFLCTSPLKQATLPREDGQLQSLGSFHQCYRLDGRLIAVGVLDLLPQGVSAVYFMYHEDVHQWHFGKIGALTEILLAKEESYRYYYMGYYIHSCIKMRYKASYAPQSVLDPDSYTWNPLDDEFLRRLDSSKYVCLSRENQLKSDTASREEVISESQDDNSIRNDEPPSTDQAGREDGEEKSLFHTNMPGILTPEQLTQTVDLDRIKVKVGRTRGKTQQLSTWNQGVIDDPTSIKGIIAELAAAIGPDLAREIVVALGG